MALLAAWTCFCLMVITASVLFQKLAQAVCPNPGEPEPSWTVILLLIQFTFIALFCCYFAETK